MKIKQSANSLKVKVKNRHLIEITISVTLEEEHRRMTLSDAERAATAAGSAVRTTLEGTTPPYEIDGDVEISHRYSHVHEHRVQRL